MSRTHVYALTSWIDIVSQHFLALGSQARVHQHQTNWFTFSESNDSSLMCCTTNSPSRVFLVWLLYRAVISHVRKTWTFPVMMNLNPVSFFSNLVPCNCNENKQSVVRTFFVLHITDVLPSSTSFLVKRKKSRPFQDFSRLHMFRFLTYIFKGQ